MATLNPNAIIAEAKLTKYILIPLAKDDKSRFLEQAGYRLENWQQLQQDLREQILPLEAIPTVSTQYGQKYAITGNLISPNGRGIRAKTIWMVTERRTQFATLFPA